MGTGPAGALLLLRGEVPFADARSGVAVLLQDLRERCGVSGQHRRVAGEAAGEFRDAAHVDRVVAAPREQRRPGRRAHRGDVEAVVTQTLCRRPVVGGGPDRAAEGARVAEPGVVNEDEQDVGGTSRRLHTANQSQSGCEPPSVLFMTPRNGGRRMGSTVRSTWSFVVNLSPMVGHQLRAERVFGHRAAPVRPD